MEKLSSGYRINRAADDAAGLAISEKMRGQIGGLAQAQRNAQDGISLVQTAEGALTEVHSMLQRVRDLKVQYDNGTLADADERRSPSEVLEIAKEVTTSSTDTKFNGRRCSTSDSSSRSAPTRVRHLVAPRASAPTSAPPASPAASRRSPLCRPALPRASPRRCPAAPGAPSAIDKPIENVSRVRANYGAVQNRLEHRLANLATYQENLTASESRIRDVDMAAEMTKFTKLEHPAAGRHEHARAGQPGPAERPLAAPLSTAKQTKPLVSGPSGPLTALTDNSQVFSAGNRW